MRRIGIAVILCGMHGICLAQFLSGNATQPSEEGDRRYRAEQYAQAVLFYQTALSLDSTDWQSTYRLAQSLRHLYQYSDALPHYRRVHTNASRTYPAAAYYYALMLKRDQRCAEALPIVAHFMDNYPNHELYREARALRQDCLQTSLMPPESSPLSLQRLAAPFNTAAHDYAAVPYRHDSSLVLTSGRWQSAHRSLDARYGENHTNLVWIEQSQEAKNRSRNIARWNSKGHDGPGCFDAARTRFYFTRCDVDYCRIYVSDHKKGKWQSPVALSDAVNGANSNSKHPALSAGGDTLFFASDRPGGEGGFDLWLSTRDSVDHWRPAVNLGGLVNTANDEIAPFYYASEDLLLFSSTGHGGLAGMDVYGLPRFTEGGDIAQPLLTPFNSVQDDCFLTIGDQRGYLSSNRTGDFDIYQFVPDSTQPLVPQLLGIRGRLPQVINQSSGASLDSILADYDLPVPAPANDIVIVHSVPEERLSNGSSRFMLASDVSEIALSRLQNRQKQARNPPDIGRSSGTSSIASKHLVTTISTDSVPQNQRGEMTGTLYEEGSGPSRVLAHSRVQLLDSTGAVAKITTTDEAGQFHFVNLNPAARYDLVVEETKNAADRTFRAQELRLANYVEATSTTPFETLYFDFNQSALRPEARQALRELARFLAPNPNTVIEINAFADSLGNDTYNLQLSRQRASTVFDFLVAQQVDPSTLVLNAEGVSTAWSSTNSQVSQQLNRRVEVRLIGPDPRYEPQAETRITRPNVSVEQLTRSLGIGLPELERLNGTSIDTLSPLKPLRIPKNRSADLGQFFFEISQQR